MERIENFAIENGIKYSLESDAYKQIKLNKETYGEPYCACLFIDHDRITKHKEDFDVFICPCSEMKKTNNCHCGLFITY